MDRGPLPLEAAAWVRRWLGSRCLARLDIYIPIPASFFTPWVLGAVGAHGEGQDPKVFHGEQDTASSLSTICLQEKCPLT